MSGLPFLRPKSVAGLIISRRKSDGSTEESHSEENEDQGIDACSEDLIRAIHAKDAKGVSSALKSLMELSKPDEDAPTAEDAASPHTYEAQNIKAAKENR